VKAPCSISSQALELIERTWPGPKRKKGRADHLGNSPPGWGRFVAIPFSYPGRAHCWHEVRGPSNHVGVCVILDSAACTLSKFGSYLAHHRVRSGHGRNDFGSLLESNDLERQLLES
jgi:hypothetical protein